MFFFLFFAVVVFLNTRTDANCDWSIKDGQVENITNQTMHWCPKRTRTRTRTLMQELSEWVVQQKNRGRCLAWTHDRLGTCLCEPRTRNKLRDDVDRSSRDKLVLVQHNKLHIRKPRAHSMDCIPSHPHAWRTKTMTNKKNKKKKKK